jgi:hypothetical protein
MDAAGLITEVTGSLGAILGVGAAAGKVVSSRRARTQQHSEGDVAKRMLYGEVLFNLLAVRLGAEVIPPTLVVQDKVYTGLLASGDIHKVDDINAVAAAATAYAVSELTSASFDIDWLKLAIIRTRGIDAQALEVLAARFREAEAALRPLVWKPPVLASIEEQLRTARALEPISMPRLFDRVQSAGVSVPGSLLVAGLGLVTDRLSTAWDRRRADRRAKGHFPPF